MRKKVKLETIISNLLYVSKIKDADGRCFSPSCILHVDELIAEFRSNQKLQQAYSEIKDRWFYTTEGYLQCLTKQFMERERSAGFYTADGILFSYGESAVPRLHITREPYNPLLHEKLKSRYYKDIGLGSFDHLSPQKAQKSIRAKSTVTIDLTKLRLSKISNLDKYRCLKISTTKYNGLNPEEQKLAERLIGQGKDFVASMQMWTEVGIQDVIIQVISPDVYREVAKRDHCVNHLLLDQKHYDKIVHFDLSRTPEPSSINLICLRR